MMLHRNKRFAALIMCFLVMVLGFSTVSAVSKEYSAFFEQDTGIKGYDDVWIYESFDTESPGATWTAAVSKGMSVFWPTLPYNIIIFEGTHPTYPGQIMANGIIHPKMDNISVTFIAPANGKVTIPESRIQRWYPEASADTGDGVMVSILKNSEKIWPSGNPQVIDKNLTPVANEFFVPEIKDISVKKNDKIRFVIKSGENDWCDDVRWEPIVLFDDLKAESSAPSSSTVSSSSSSAAQSSADSSQPTSEIVSTDLSGDIISDELSSEISETTETSETESVETSSDNVSAVPTSEGADDDSDSKGSIGTIIAIIAAVVIIIAGGTALFLKKKKSVVK